jgi:uncharacterized protein (TIGR03437 family)
MYCTGLGATTPPVATGAPSTQATVTTPVTVTIGTVLLTTAGQIPYAGLTPGSVGLYQINFVVPPGVTPGSAVPVKITQNGVDSNIATIAVK